MTDRPVHPIEAESYAILTARVDLSNWPDGSRDVVARVIHATADESFATSMRVGARAVDTAVSALQRRAPVVCDSRMVVAGIPRVAAVTDVICLIDRVPDLAPPATRSAAAISRAVELQPEGAIWVVGNAPTALARLIQAGLDGLVRPAAVIGLPVGYVGAAEAKDALWSSSWQEIAITNSGPRGGSPVAAAAMNALARLAGMGGPQPGPAAPSPR
jgi:precorrin-8X/cobalt-precorrin-8 methylmutase